MPRPKQLPDDHVRVTVRLSQTLVAELVGFHRRYVHTGGGSLSAVVRKALDHYLACPDLRRAEEDHEAVVAYHLARIEQEMAAFAQELDAKEEAREARRQANRDTAPEESLCQDIENKGRLGGADTSDHRTDD